MQFCVALRFYPITFPFAAVPTPSFHSARIRMPGKAADRRRSRSDSARQGCGASESKHGFSAGQNGAASAQQRHRYNIPYSDPFFKNHAFRHTPFVHIRTSRNAAILPKQPSHVPLCAGSPARRLSEVCIAHGIPPPVLSQSICLPDIRLRHDR